MSNILVPRDLFQEFNGLVPIYMATSISERALQPAIPKNKSFRVRKPQNAKVSNEKTIISHEESIELI